MMTRTLWPVLLAAAITGCTDCGAPPEPDYEWDDPLGRGTPWLVPDVVDIAGRVVSPAGEPLGAMRIELVYPGDPHWGETLAFTSFTDDDGRFVFEGVCGRCFALVVRGSGGALTYREPLPLGEDFTVVYAPTRRVPVRVHCAVAPTMELKSWPWESPSLRADWLPDRGTVASVRLPAVAEGAELSGDSLSLVLPGWSTTVPRVDADARHFGAMVPLPEGDLRVTVLSPCGSVSRVVRVPGDPIELRLPTEDHARITLSRAAAAMGAPLRVRVVFEGEQLELEGDELGAFGRVELVADRLAAGDYTIAGDGWQCPVTLRPRTHARVALSRQGCEVEEEPL